ncbi:MAG TPA: hypothetical protein VMS77_00935 [Conexivisphaerales archaeon]|nr:hypothetical protein [Conexivisphaerales archaeon]
MSNIGYGRKAKTVTRSFRISEAAFDALTEDAARERVSVNTLVNQLFMSYADYDRFFRKLGIIRMSSATFGHLLEMASEEEVAKAGFESGSDIPETIMLAKEGKATLAVAVRFMETLSAYSGMFDGNMVVAEGKTTVTLMHNFGPKGSLFFRSYCEALFKSVGVRPNIISAEHSITVELPTAGPAEMPWSAEEELTR